MKYFYLFMIVVATLGTILPPYGWANVLNFFCALYWVYSYTNALKEAKNDVSGTL